MPKKSRSFSDQVDAPSGDKEQLEHLLQWQVISKTNRGKAKSRPDVFLASRNCIALIRKRSRFLGHHIVGDVVVNRLHGMKSPAHADEPGKFDSMGKMIMIVVFNSAQL
jgi:hypothetical protein